MLGICSQWRGGAHLPSAECLFQQWISQLILISPILRVISSSLLSNALYQFLYSGWNCYFLTSSAKHEASNISLSFINNLEFHLQLRFRELLISIYLENPRDGGVRHDWSDLAAVAAAAYTSNKGIYVTLQCLLRCSDGVVKFTSVSQTFLLPGCPPGRLGQSFVYGIQIPLLPSGMS